MIIIAASKCREQEATLIVTGFLWSMWPSRLGHDWYSQANSKLEFGPGWLAGYGWFGWVGLGQHSVSQSIIIMRAAKL